MKSIKVVLVALIATIMVSSCGISYYPTSNVNSNQTDVVLSQNNFKIVKTVSAEENAVYICGIGGLSKAALKANVVAELTKKAGLTGSQALININVKQSGYTYLGIYSKYTFTAEGTVVEFTE